MPPPIDAAQILWAEELTSMEIRDALRAEITTIIIGTGGVEQNGPYVAQSDMPELWQADSKELASREAFHLLKMLLPHDSSRQPSS